MSLRKSDDMNADAQSSNADNSLDASSAGILSTCVTSMDIAQSKDEKSGLETTPTAGAVGDLQHMLGKQTTPPNLAQVVRVRAVGSGCEMCPPIPLSAFFTGRNLCATGFDIMVRVARHVNEHRQIPPVEPTEHLLYHDFDEVQHLFDQCLSCEMQRERKVYLRTCKMYRDSKCKEELFPVGSPIAGWPWRTLYLAPSNARILDTMRGEMMCAALGLLRSTNTFINDQHHRVLRASLERMVNTCTNGLRYVSAMKAIHYAVHCKFKHTHELMSTASVQSDGRAVFNDAIESILDEWTDQANQMVFLWLDLNEPFLCGPKQAATFGLMREK